MSKFDFNTDLQLRDDLRETLKVVQTQAASIALQLGTWLVVGNAAGIFFLAGAAAEGFIAINGQFNHAYFLFLVGAALAFIAMCWTYFWSIPFAATISRMSIELLLRAQRAQLTEELAAQGKGPPPDFETADAAAKRLWPLFNQRIQRTWFVFGTAIGIYTLSGTCFLFALAAPLLGGITLVDGLRP